MKIQNVMKVENLAEETKNILNSEDSKSSKIKRLFLIGYEIKEIANFLNIRYNFVYNVIQNFTIIQDIQTIQNNTISKKDEINRLFQENKSPKEIAIILKTNLNYIYKIIAEIKDNQNI